MSTAMSQTTSLLQDRMKPAREAYQGDMLIAPTHNDYTQRLSLHSTPPRKLQTAIISDDQGNLIISRNNIPIPTLENLEPDQLLVRVQAVALNPVDVKLTGDMACPGAVAGHDFSGIVVAVGFQQSADGTGSEGRRTFEVGDRVCGATVPMDSLNPAANGGGAFAEYAVVVADFALKVPDTMTMHDAASLGIGLATVGYALFHSLGLKMPPISADNTPTPSRETVLNPSPTLSSNESIDAAETGKHILVYGGSTASGTLALQLLQLAGYTPLTTCSPHNFSLVERHGAAKVWDYAPGESAAASIRAYSGNRLEHALDCVCTPASMDFCYRALGRLGGQYITLEPYSQQIAQTRSRRVKPDWILGPALLGKPVGWKGDYEITETRPELREFGRTWFDLAQELLDRGLLKTHPVRVGEKNGFEDDGGILHGIELLKKKQVSGKKLVYYI
ncbi:Trans-enoyl reductase [Rhypophila decipiens]